ncbi:MAG: hypothetical protein H7202_12695 [Pedobacter sp.]|nr:hypothetical protein [Pedobacter sp.]
MKLGYQGTTPFEIYYADLEKEGQHGVVDKYGNDPNVVFLFVNTWEKQKSK